MLPDSDVPKTSGSIAQTVAIAVIRIGRIRVPALQAALREWSSSLRSV
ncbi:hypothetical protein [Cohnella faecalis]|nr:hypothetical protein [Cohnella faecalis]